MFPYRTATGALLDSRDLTKEANARASGERAEKIEGAAGISPSRRQLYGIG